MQEGVPSAVAAEGDAEDKVRGGIGDGGRKVGREVREDVGEIEGCAVYGASAENERGKVPGGEVRYIENISCACVRLPDRHASFANGVTSRLPWLRWSKDTAIRAEDLDEGWEFQAWRMVEARAAMQDWVCKRGWSSQRQERVLGRGGSSERP